MEKNEENRKNNLEIEKNVLLNAQRREQTRKIKYHMYMKIVIFLLKVISFENVTYRDASHIN